MALVSAYPEIFSADPVYDALHFATVLATQSLLSSK